VSVQFSYVAFIENQIKIWKLW